MTPPEQQSSEAMSVKPSEAGSLKPDAGPDAGSADYGEEMTAEEKNASSHEDNPVPETSREKGNNDDVAQEQMKIIGRMSG